MSNTRLSIITHKLLSHEKKERYGYLLDVPTKALSELERIMKQ
jgi:hypothetical protein